MVVFDAQMLIWLLDPGATPLHPETGQPVRRARERLEHLVSTLEQDRTPIVVPTPALSEFLVYAGAARAGYLERLNKQSTFRIEPFDQRAAIEAAIAIHAALAEGDKRGGSRSSWQKVKFDQQIVAIAKVHGAETIYSDDTDLLVLAERQGVKVVKLADIPPPPEPPQADLPFEDT